MIQDNRNKDVCIIYDHFLNDDRCAFSIGGIQSYLLNLAKILRDDKYKVIFIQKSKEDFSVKLETFSIIGLNVSERKFPLKAVALVEKVYTNSLVIFGTEELVTRYKGKSIAIQHGIYWDKAKHRNYPKFVNRLYVWRRARQAFCEIRKISYVNKLIAVDYNFVNWYRTQLSYPEVDIEVIPNFSEIPSVVEKSAKKIGIIFARRLFDYRGTRIMAVAMSHVLKKYSDKIYLTVAGEGPDEEYLRKVFSDFTNVDFIKYCSKESILIHQKHHISLIPTIGSEGTSLSLLEAMASGCAVICSDVGGMTNIILDGFNGLMVKAGNVTSLEDAINKLIEDKELREKLATNAYLTVKDAFSHKIWSEKWRRLIKEVEAV